MQVLVACRGIHSGRQRIKWVHADWVGLHEVLRDSLCSVSPGMNVPTYPCLSVLHKFVCIHLGLLLVLALQWEPQQCYRVGGRSFNSALPLRLRAFDQAKVMFTCLATSVAITAIRNRPCLVGGETLVLYLNQVKDKRSMA